MLPCMFDNRQHEILSGGEIMPWVETQISPEDKDKFFLYRHRLHGTFVLARWVIDRATGIFTDFLHIGNSLSEFTHAKALEFRKRLYAPLTASKISKAITQSNRDFVSEQIEQDAEQVERAKMKY